MAGMIQQQQATMQAILNSERGRPAAQAQGIDDKYNKKVESFYGEQAWLDLEFQFKSHPRDLPVLRTQTFTAHLGPKTLAPNRCGPKHLRFEIGRTRLMPGFVSRNATAGSLEVWPRRDAASQTNMVYVMHGIMILGSGEIQSRHSLKMSPQIQSQSQLAF